MKHKSKPQIAFLFLMIPILYLLAMLLFGSLATVLEGPLNLEGIYLLFVSIFIFFAITVPAVFTACSIISLVFQVMVYKSEGLQIKTILMTIASLAYAVSSVVYAQQLWINMMYG